MSQTLGTSSGCPFWSSALSRRKRRIRQRAQMPDDLDRPLEVAVLDRRDVRRDSRSAATDRRAATARSRSRAPRRRSPSSRPRRRRRAAPRRRTARAARRPTDSAAPSRYGTLRGVTGAGDVGALGAAGEDREEVGRSQAGPRLMDASCRTAPRARRSAAAGCRAGSRGSGSISLRSDLSAMRSRMTFFWSIMMPYIRPSGRGGQPGT